MRWVVGALEVVVVLVICALLAQCAINGFSL